MLINKEPLKEQKLFLKDPETSKLGQKIINHSIRLIDENGFEDFTFKKLALSINCTEASIYRYFENKHMLLFYLLTWYWTWFKYNIDYHTINLKSPNDKLKTIIKIMFKTSATKPSTTYIDERLLNRIVIIESGKAYIRKFVEENYNNGLFKAYDDVCNKISDIIRLINVRYDNPKALAVTLINTAHNLEFYSRNLAGFTDIKIKEDDTGQIERFLENIIFSALKSKK